MAKDLQKRALLLIRYFNEFLLIIAFAKFSDEQTWELKPLIGIMWGDFCNIKPEFQRGPIHTT